MMGGNPECCTKCCIRRGSPACPLRCFVVPRGVCLFWCLAGLACAAVHGWLPDCDATIMYSRLWCVCAVQDEHSRLALGEVYSLANAAPNSDHSFDLFVQARLACVRACSHACSRARALVCLYLCRVTLFFSGKPVSSSSEIGEQGHSQDEPDQSYSGA